MVRNIKFSITCLNIKYYVGVICDEIVVEVNVLYVEFVLFLLRRRLLIHNLHRLELDIYLVVFRSCAPRLAEIVIYGLFGASISSQVTAQWFLVMIQRF